MSEYTITELLDLVAERGKRIAELEADKTTLQKSLANACQRIVELKAENERLKAFENTRQTYHNALQELEDEQIAELEAERDDYKDRWEQTGCTRHGAMEAAIKTNDSLLKRIEELGEGYSLLLTRCNVLEAKLESTRRG